jgi:predicted alpha/beta superfamily hydrolase
VEWKVDKVLDELIATGKVEEMLVVGIYNGELQRGYEYVPYPKNVKELEHIKTPYNSGAKKFADFMVERIIPYVESTYHTLTDRANRAIMGASYGGIAALWIGYTYSDVFSMIGAMSPSFWVGDGHVFRDFTYKTKKDVKIWYDIGTLEWSDYTALIDILVVKGFSYGHDLFYYEDKGARHHETAWTKRVMYPFILFQGKPPQTIVDFYVDVEVVKTGAGIIATKLNPVIEMDNGIKYSLYKFAKYEVLTKEHGRIDAHGYFEFLSEKNLVILVKYRHLEKQIEVDYQKIQDEIRQLE